MTPIMLLLPLMGLCAITRRYHRLVETPLESALQGDFTSAVPSFGRSILKIGSLACSKKIGVNWLSSLL